MDMVSISQYWYFMGTCTPTAPQFVTMDPPTHAMPHTCVSCVVPRPANYSRIGIGMGKWLRHSLTPCHYRHLRPVEVGPRKAIG